jgi:threonine synthase
MFHGSRCFTGHVSRFLEKSPLTSGGNVNHYFYKCFDCNSRFSIKEIEPIFQYLCPRCGKAEKNQPLTGVLWVEYDFGKLKRELGRGDFLNFVCGEFWHYPQLWPLDFCEEKGRIIIRNVSKQQLNRIRLNTHPLLEYKIDERVIMFFDDTRNPTLSYKDRASIIVAVKALQMEIKEIAAASTGNAGSSLAGICAQLGLKAHLFVPESIPTAKRLQIQALGAEIYLVNGGYDQAFDLSLEISKIKGWYNRNTAYNPLTIEGKKSGAYDIFIACGGKVPDIILVPVGDGVILSGMFKGFWELVQLGWIEKMPRLMAVQSEGSDALVRYLETGKFKYQPASTVADSICAGAPRDLYMAAYAVRESNGIAISVSDDEILQAQKRLAKQTGLLVEPAAAASLAGYQKLKSKGIISGSQSRILLMMTGNGLKDVEALNQWNPVPDARSVVEWKKKKRQYFQ